MMYTLSKTFICRRSNTCGAFAFLCFHVFIFFTFPTHGDQKSVSDTIYLNVPSGKSITLQTQISETGSFQTTYEKTGDGNLIFNPMQGESAGANTYAGNTYISGGTLSLQTDASLPLNTVLYLNKGTLAIVGSTLTLTQKVNVAAASAINSNGNVIYLNGAVADNGFPLTLQGGGTVSFGGSNTLTGGLYIGDGTAPTTLILQGASVIGSNPLYVRGPRCIWGQTKTETQCIPCPFPGTSATLQV